jgi:hypothetical protein
MRRHFLLSAWLLLLPGIAYGQSVSIVWDPQPPGEQVTGYDVCISTTPLSCNLVLASVAGTETLYTYSPTPGVLFRVAVRARNAAGAGAYSSEVAASIPALTQPPNQTSTINAPITPLTLTASDPDGSALQFTHTGLPLGLSLNASTGVISGVPISAGTFNVTVFVSDNLETTSRTFVWTIQGTGGADTSAPSLAISSHTSGQTVTTSSITLAGTASDSGAGGSGITSVTVNGATATGGTASGNNTANWSRSVALSTGANNLTVVATDGAGNVRTSTLTITRTSGADTTAPTLAITSHTAGQTVGSSSITLSGTATDSGSGGSGITSVRVNGAAASGGTATGSNTANWSRNVTLATGANTLTVVATDGAGNTRTTPISITYAVSAVTSVTLTPLLSSPRVTGTSITFSAVGSGGASPTQYKFLVQRDGGTQQMLRSWSSSSTYAWVPTIPGSYTVSVWARSAGVTTDAPQASAQVPYVITGPLAATSITADRPSPQNLGTTVTFTAAATGGTAPYSYKWWILLNGVWTMGRDWSTSPTFSWTPSTDGSYQIGVWVRSANTTADTNAVNLAIPYIVNTSQLVATGISANLSSPRAVGTTVTFTAGATGGTGPYSYKWWVLFDGNWTMVRDWSTSPTFAWTPSNPGNYQIGIWVRSANTTADTNAVNSAIPYVVSGSSTPGTGSLVATGISASPSSLQSPGTTATFTAGATGGTAPYSYKWWVLLNGTWTLGRDWSTSATFAWTPSAPGSYRIGVWVRGANTTADTNAVNYSIPYDVGGGSGTTGTALRITNLTTNVPTPARVGQSVTAVASATGGTGQYQFKWWMFNGVSWVMVRDWGSSTLTFTPTSANVNPNFRLGVWARNAGSNDDSGSVNFSIAFPIVP